MAAAHTGGRPRVTSDEDRFEAFETLSGTLVVFLGLQGSDGLLRLSRGGAWEFLPAGSLDWDGYHQEIYRNFRGDRLDAEALTRRGIALPPLGEYRTRPSVSWPSNFPSEMPLPDVPPEQRPLLTRGAFSVFLVLYEDGYETAFGDGKYLYPARAFADRAQADAFLEDRRREAENPSRATDPAKAEWYRYTLKPIRITVDGERVRAELDLQPFEHVSVRDVLRLLAEEGAAG